MQTQHKLASIGLALALSLSAASSFAQVMVGGASMPTNREAEPRGSLGSHEP